MTELEIKAAFELSGCTFIPGIAAKRLARQWAAKAKDRPHEPMTPQGRRMLFLLCYRYRRQIDDDEVLSEAARIKSLEPKKEKFIQSADSLYRQELEKRGMRTIGEAKNDL
jgi:hypothetical protein